MPPKLFISFRSPHFYSLCVRTADKNWEDIVVPSNTSKIYSEELSEILANVYDMVTEIPKYGNFKIGQCKERRKVWLLSKIRKVV